MEMADTLNVLLKKYNIDGFIIDYKKIINGHINFTYDVIVRDDAGNDIEYIFQKINDYVFKDPTKVMHNIREIHDYMERTHKKGICKIVEFLINADGCNYTILDNNNFWRVCRYEPNTVTYENVKSAGLLYNAGFAFGDFLNTLSDMPIEHLEFTIEDFHNTKKRLADFFDIVNADPEGRVKNVGPEIEFLAKYREHFSELSELEQSGVIPRRVVHNDTKYNNILIDKDTDLPVCVVDLDTIMPGLVMHDYGDAIRFSANTALEDETDLSKVDLNMDYFEQFTRGFITASKPFLMPVELEYMALGAPTITFELASRFLGDYLNGDKYFHIHRPDHNLDRARCQLKLAEVMINKYDDMQKIVRKYS